MSERIFFPKLLHTVSVITLKSFRKKIWGHCTSCKNEERFDTISLRSIRRTSQYRNVNLNSNFMLTSSSDTESQARVPSPESLTWIYCYLLGISHFILSLSKANEAVLSEVQFQLFRFSEHQAHSTKIDKLHVQKHQTSYIRWT